MNEDSCLGITVFTSAALKNKETMKVNVWFKVLSILAK
jgi:hypothetical protein